MDISRNVRWNIPFKKFNRLRVNEQNSCIFLCLFVCLFVHMCNKDVIAVHKCITCILFSLISGKLYQTARNIRKWQIPTNLCINPNIFILSLITLLIPSFIFFLLTLYFKWFIFYSNTLQTYSLFNRLATRVINYMIYHWVQKRLLTHDIKFDDIKLKSTPGKLFVLSV